METDTHTKANPFCSTSVPTVQVNKYSGEKASVNVSSSQWVSPSSVILALEVQVAFVAISTFKKPIFFFPAFSLELVTFRIWDFFSCINSRTIYVLPFSFSLWKTLIFWCWTCWMGPLTSLPLIFISMSFPLGQLIQRRIFDIMSWVMGLEWLLVF